MREITKPITNPVAIEGEKPKVELWPTFQDFWDAYDHKKSRVKAEVAWKRLKQGDKEKAMEVIPAYVRSTPNKKFRKHPTTWLNQECWNDEIEEDDKGFSDDTRDFLIREILAGGR